MYLVLFLVDLLYFKKLLQNLEETFFIISSTWSVNFQIVLPFYELELWLFVQYLSPKRVAC